MQEKTLCDERKVVDNLAAVGLNRPRGLHRVVVEKPFGEFIETGQLLDQLLRRHFDEQQIYHIDHYLRSEATVPSWNWR